MKINFTCPEVQAVSPTCLANVLAAIESKKITDGPLMVYDKDRGVFLTLSMASGVIIGWVMTSCATAEEASRECARAQIIAEALADAALQPGSPAQNDARGSDPLH